MSWKNLETEVKNLINLTLRNLKSKYASTILGILWAGLIPLILMLAITFVFIKVLKIDQQNFHIFILAGILPWLYFSNVIMESTQAFVKNKSLMRQFSFPKLLYPLSITFSNLIQHIIGLFFLLPFFIFYNYNLPYRFILLGFPILSFTIFLSGVSIITALVNLYIRDLEHFLGIALMVLFWITPVFYQPWMVPASYRLILYLNPLSYFIESYRTILLKNYTSFINLNKFYLLILNLIFLILIYILYKKINHLIIKKI